MFSIHRLKRKLTVLIEIYRISVYFYGIYISFCNRHGLFLAVSLICFQTFDYWTDIIKNQST